MELMLWRKNEEINKYLGYFNFDNHLTCEFNGCVSIIDIQQIFYFVTLFRVRITLLVLQHFIIVHEKCVHVTPKVLHDL